jgi:ubiquinone/menaquinone biosynthesis C-methylase UbiE
MVKVIERLNPTNWVPPWIYYQHIARYLWAAPFAKGKYTVDAACGSGYGTRMLRDAGAKWADGFDLCSEAIDEARKCAQADNLRYGIADVLNLPAEDGQYDLYTSFETIEHIQDDSAFLMEVYRVLKPEGTFICSTPNRLLTNPGITLADKPFNPFHIREYTRDELTALLGNYFSSIDFFGQSNYGLIYTNVLNTIGKQVPKLAVRSHQIRKMLGIPFCKLDHHFPLAWKDNMQPEIMIAICSQKK